MSNDFQPAAARVIDLADGITSLSGLENFQHVNLLVCFDSIPIGSVRCRLQGGALDAASIYDAIENDLGSLLARELLATTLESGLPETGIEPADIALAKVDEPAPPCPHITVAVCTRDRPDDLAECLEAIAALDYPAFDVIVVDNAPTSDASRELVSKLPGVRHVVEERPGLNWARNRAVSESTGDILAFADDDVRVHSGWLRGIARGFADNPMAVAVTGLVIAADLESDAQSLFETHGGFARGYKPMLVRANPDDHALWQLYGTGRFGTGANMAFKRSVFDTIGRFDPALDVGTVTHGGGDLEYLFRVLREGHALAYEPTAICLHRHRRTMRELRRQIFNNGIGWVSACCRCAAAYPDATGKLIHVVSWWAWSGSLKPLLRSIWRPGRTPAGLRRLWLLDIAGYIAGLPAYWRSRREQRKVGRQDEPSAAPLWPKRPVQSLTRPARSFRATAIRTIELAEPVIQPVSSDDYAQIRIFAMLGGTPLGDITLTSYGLPISARRLRSEIAARLFDSLTVKQSGMENSHWWQALSDAMRTRILGAAHAELVTSKTPPSKTPSPARTATRLPTVTVVVPTADRPDNLKACLAALVTQDYGGCYGIIVADNRPDSGISKSVVAEFAGVDYVAESRPGVAYARNCGAARASGEIIVFADDDTVAPPQWLTRLSEAFERPQVAAVSGNVLPLKLDTAAQLDFELYGALGRGYQAWDADRSWFDSHIKQAVETWRLGGTANLAVRSAILRNPVVGLQREELGPGTPTGVGEDIYLFYRLLKAGHTVAYDPAAWLWHNHRSTGQALKRQLYGYSKGFVAYNLVTLLVDGDRRALWTLLWHLPLYDLKRLARFLRRSLRLHGKPGYPLTLQLWEIAGHIAGPFALFRSVRRVRRLGRSSSVGDAGV